MTGNTPHLHLDTSHASTAVITHEQTHGKKFAERVDVKAHTREAKGGGALVGGDERGRQVD